LLEGEETVDRARERGCWSVGVEVLVVRRMLVLGMRCNSDRNETVC